MTGDSFFDSVRSLGIVRHSDTPLAGVCAGLAERWKVDPLIVRAIFVALVFLGGAGVTLYALGWMFLPDRTDRIHAQEPFYGQISGSLIVAAILVFVPLSSFGFGLSEMFLFGPLGLLIAAVIATVVGITLYSQVQNQKGSGPQPGHNPGDQATFTPPAPVPGTDDPNASHGSFPTSTTTSSAHSTDPYRSGSDTYQSSAPAPAAEYDRPWRNDSNESRTSAPDRSELYSTVTEDLDRPDNRPVAGARAVLIGLAFILIVAAATAFLATQEYVDISTNNLIVGGLGVTGLILGLAVIMYGVLGCRGGGLSALAILVAVLSLPAAALMSLPHAEHHVFLGEQTWAPQSIEDTEGGYSVFMGSLEVDVRDITEGEIDIHGRMGDINIVVNENQNIAVVTDFTMSSMSDASGNTTSDSGFRGDVVYYVGDISSVKDADLVIHVNIIMADLSIERTS